MRIYKGESDRGLVIIQKPDNTRIVKTNGFGDGMVKLHVGTYADVREREDWKDGRFIKIMDLEEGDRILDYDVLLPMDQTLYVVEGTAELYSRRGNTRANLYVLYKEA
jgi:hypothetical protein